MSSPSQVAAPTPELPKFPDIQPRNAVSSNLITQRFEQVARRQPNAVALTCVPEDPGSPDRQVSYAELNRRANAVAWRLRASGVAFEDVVGLVVSHDLETVAAILGIWKAGACLLPLDPNLPNLRLAHVLKRSFTNCVLVASKHRSLFESTGAKCMSIDGEDSIRSSVNLNLPVDGANAAYVIYTSGTTGEPKGVVVTHGALANHAASFARLTGLTAADTLLQFANLAFDAAYEELLPALCSGARVVLGNEAISRDLQQFLEVCDSRNVTALDLPTAFWHVLVRFLQSGTTMRFPRSIAWVVLGGEEVLPAAVRFWHQTFKSHPVLYNSYGPTESTIISTLGQLTEGADEISLGACLPGTLTAPYDMDGRPCEVGEQGELCISGPCLARGYLHDPCLTAQRFLPANDGRLGARCYKTGDLGELTTSGSVLFKGRRDNQVKVNGHRVQLEEVEDALLSHPSIGSCAVMLRDDRKGGKHLVAYCVLAHQENPLPFENKPLQVTELRQFLSDRLPHYMIPGDFSFLERFILTPNGKIDRSKLPELGNLDRWARRLPDYQKPKSGLEARLAAVWSDVLDLDPSEISVDDPFEYLGGNSLYSIQVRYKAQQSGILFAAQDFHLRQTIRGLAKCSESVGAASKLRHALRDYYSYFANLANLTYAEAKKSLASPQTAADNITSQFQRFYSSLGNTEDVFYIYFTRHLLHWLS